MDSTSLPTFTPFQGPLQSQLLFSSTDSDENHVLQNLNYLYQIKDVQLRQEYYSFASQKHGTRFFLFTTLLNTFGFIPLCFAPFVFEYFHNDTLKLNWTIALFIPIFICAICGWILCYRKVLKKSSLARRCSWQEKDMDTMFYWLQHILVISWTVFFTLQFIRKIYAPVCDFSGRVIEMQYEDGYCVDQNVKPALVLGNALLTTAPSLFFFATLPSTRIELIWMLLLAVSIVSIFIAVEFKAKSSIIWYVGWVIGISLVICDIQTQNLTIYLTTRQCQEALKENELMADELHANELRHMIGNVAHDLKTPLASFTTGIDHIQLLVDEHSINNASCGLCKGLAAAVQSCIHNIRNTNSLMLMTVNRCIDYTKASKGLKLVPRYETIDLMEALQLPLNCMRNLQHRIEIKLKEVTDDICSHIITDRQWLHENLLCLLSNAVKYSSEGFVTIAVSMARKGDVESHQENKIQEDQIEDPVIDIYPSPSRYGNDKLNMGLSINTNISSHSNNLDDHSNNQFLLFEIEDNGIGISEEDMATLFHPFKPTQRLAGGTGLGLYSLAKRVEALKGYYGVRRRKDGQQGSLFWFMVPYRPDRLTAALVTPRASNSISNTVGNSYKSEIVSSSSSSLDPVVGKSSLRILIVDDSPSIVKMTSMMLKKLGHDITSAENGEVAIKKITKQWTSTEDTFDVILMDLQMPIMDGLEATRRLRKLEASGNVTPMVYGRNSNNEEIAEKHLLQTLSCEALLSVPLPKQVIIGMSANSDNDTTEAAYHVGVDAFLSKPFNVSTFSDIATALLAEKKRQECDVTTTPY